MPLTDAAIDDLLRRAWDAQAAGDIDAAIALYQQILVDRDVPPAWLGVGQCHLERKDSAAALEAFRRAGALMPNSGAIRHMIAMLEGGAPPDRAPDDYVLWVFDGHADNFDAHLAALQYRGPEMIAALAAAAWPKQANRTILDLGCGTGLNAPLFRPYAARLDGLDLAPRMLRQANRRGYDHLYKAEIHTFLRRPPIRYDVLLSTDVFIYIGKLEEIFSLSKQQLSENGEILCTIELGAPDDPPVQLMSSGRFRQTDAYIRASAAAADFEVAAFADETLRIENGLPEPGRAYRFKRSQ